MKSKQSKEDKEPLRSYMSKGVATLYLRHSSLVNSHSFFQGDSLLEIQRCGISPGSALFRSSSYRFARTHCKYKQTLPFFPNLERKAVVEKSGIINFIAILFNLELTEYKKFDSIKFETGWRFLGEIIKSFFNKKHI